MLEIGLEINLDTSAFDAGLELFMRKSQTFGGWTRFDKAGRSIIDDFALGMKPVMSWAQADYFAKCATDLLHNTARRHLWPRTAALLALAIAGVAILCR